MLSEFPWRNSWKKEMATLFFFIRHRGWLLKISDIDIGNIRHRGWLYSLLYICAQALAVDCCIDHKFCFTWQHVSQWQKWQHRNLQRLTSTILSLRTNWSILVNTSSFANSHCLTSWPSLKNFWIFFLISSNCSLKQVQTSIAFRVFSWASSASDLKISAGSKYNLACQQHNKAAASVTEKLSAKLHE